MISEEAPSHSCASRPNPSSDRGSAASSGAAPEAGEGLRDPGKSDGASSVPDHGNGPTHAEDRAPIHLPFRSLRTSPWVQVPRTQTQPTASLSPNPRKTTALEPILEPSRTEPGAAPWVRRKENAKRPMGGRAMRVDAADGPTPQVRRREVSGSAPGPTIESATPPGATKKPGGIHLDACSI